MRLFIAGLCVALLARGADASIVFSGSGNNPEVSASASGSAEFSISGDLLTLVLTNTTAPRSTAQGNALTGVSFDIGGLSGPLTLTGLGLTDGSDKIWTSPSSASVGNPLSGSWTSKLGTSALGEYGVATSGFGGRFNGGSITRGNSSADYGIVAEGTFDGTGLPFGGARFPFVQNSLTFTFSGANGLSENSIQNVKLLFGTDGTGIVTAFLPPPPSPADGAEPLPEPASLAIWGLGACACAIAALRRRASAS